MAYDRLTAADAAFLRVETAHEPQHVGSLSIIEGAPLRDATGRVRIEDVREHVAGRLHRVPRLRQRLMEVPYGLGRPIWVDDARFDLDYHVRLTSLPRPGDEAQLRALMGRLQSLPLDRDRPLWELWMVDGLAGDDLAMVIKTHHAMGDGIANVDMALALVDLESDTVAEEAPDWNPRPAPAPSRLSADSLLDQLEQPGRLARAWVRALRDPRPVLRSARNVGRTALAFAAQADPAPWNQPVSPHRRWVSADVPMHLVRDLRDPYDVTINDVVLAACSGALRSFLREHGDAVENRELKAMVPVSLRRDDEHGDTLGNRVSMVVVDLPVDEANPLMRLARVRARMRVAKESGLADGAERIVKIADAVPGLSSTLTRLVSRRIPMNLVVTNVPGPPMPLFLMGARIRRTYPYVEVIDHEGLTIAVVSYDGQLHFGITSDRDVIPDLGLVAEAIEKEFHTLAASVTPD